MDNRFMRIDYGRMIGAVIYDDADAGTEDQEADARTGRRLAGKDGPCTIPPKWWVPGRLGRFLPIGRTS